MTIEFDNTPPKGIRPDFYMESVKIVKDATSMIKGHRTIHTLLEEQLSENETLGKVLGLGAVFSVMTALAMEWSRRETMSQLAAGALLQKIGITQLENKSVMLSEDDLLDPVTVSAYQRHPFLGARLLGAESTLTEVVKQIVYQRHELFNGGGYPNGVSGFKIFPPARIVAVCSDLADLMIIHDLEAVVALKQLLSTAKNASNYDPESIKGLVGIFNKKGKSPAKKKV